MTKFIGRQLQVGVAREASRGGGAATPSIIIPHVDFSFDDKVSRARLSPGLGKLADSEQALVTNRYGQGDLNMDLRDQSIGYFLYSLLGTLSTTGPTDSAYTHAFSVSESVQHQSLALLVKDENITEEYKLAMVEQLEIVATMDETVKAIVSFMSKKGEAWTNFSTALTDENKFTKKHVTMKVAGAVGDLTAATAVSIKALRLLIKQNLGLDDSLGTAEPEDILNHQLTVEGEVTLNYSDATWKGYFRDPTDRAMEIKLVQNDATIGAGTNPSLTIRMPKVDFHTWDANYALDEIVTQTLSFKASYDVANTLNIISTCDLVNAKTAYTS